MSLLQPGTSVPVIKTRIATTTATATSQNLFLQTRFTPTEVTLESKRPTEKRRSVMVRTKTGTRKCRTGTMDRYANPAHPRNGPLDRGGKRG
jgi:hypothetical protein